MKDRLSCFCIKLLDPQIREILSIQKFLFSITGPIRIILLFLRIHNTPRNKHRCVFPVISSFYPRHRLLSILVFAIFTIRPVMIILFYHLISIRFVASFSLLLRKSIWIDFKIPIIAVSKDHIFLNFLFLIFRPLFVKSDQIFFCKIPWRIHAPVYIVLFPGISRLVLSIRLRKKYLLRSIDLIMFVFKIQQLRCIRLFFHNHIFTVRQIP